jgi:hypothetical protein
LAAAFIFRSRPPLYTTRDGWGLAAEACLLTRVGFDGLGGGLAGSVRNVTGASRCVSGRGDRAVRCLKRRQSRLVSVLALVDVFEQVRERKDNVGKKLPELTILNPGVAIVCMNRSVAEILDHLQVRGVKFSPSGAQSAR